MTAPYVLWNPADSRRLDTEVFVARHRLQELPCFQLEYLAELLDRYPREHLGVNTMGSDPTCRSEWRDGEAGEYSGRELLEIAGSGRLWLNLRKVTRVDRTIGDAVEKLYADLEAAVPGLHTSRRSANLLISSPTALVYYHCDMPVNVLWHIRGRKRVWVYPRREPFVSQQLLEDTLVGRHAEEWPYSPDFDQHAACHDLEPGQVVFWPQHSPHRVTNLSGLNVSLSTEHMTRGAVRRNNVFMANRYFRPYCPWFCRSERSDGTLAAAKEFAIRLARRLPWYSEDEHRGYRYEKSFVVDHAAPDGVRLRTNDAEASCVASARMS